MTSIQAPSGQLLTPHSYDDFQGVDSSRDVASLDTGKQQALYQLNNGYVNYRGIIMRDRSVSRRVSTPGDRLIPHVAFYGKDLIAWAQRDGGGITLKAEPNDAEAKEVYLQSAGISSTVFNNKLVFFSEGSPMYTYDGTSFKKSNNTRETPAFGVSIQRRLAIAGGLDRRTIVDFSRVDDIEAFTRDESPSDTSVTKAADIDVKNIIGTNDEITGLGVFERSRIAVFTNDQTLVYNISPDFTKWAIDDKASIGVGCVSHNSIANVGTDIIFCSRNGVHSLRRSEANGVTIYAVPLSSKIEELYESLYNQVSNKRDISAYYDQDEGQYHVFFPRSDQYSTRLTMTIAPTPDGQNKWSTATFLNQRCGASLGGVVCVGTSGGVFEVKRYDDTNFDLTPDMEVVTPILWHGSLTETKESKQFIIQASGTGRLEIEAYNQEMVKMTTITIDLDNPHDTSDDYTFLPLSKQYARTFACQYKGVQFRIKTKGGQGRIKIIGLAVMVRAAEKKTGR